jgi:hypothetical protein
MAATGLTETDLAQANATYYVSEIRDLCDALASLVSIDAREDVVPLMLHTEIAAIRARLCTLLGIE